MPASAAQAITILSDLLQHESAAVETYDQAIVRLRGQYVDELKAIRASHVVSASALGLRIGDLAGEARAVAGPWPGFAKAVEGAAALLGVDRAIAALDEGETRGLDAYRRSLDGLDPASRTLVESELLPAQERSQARMRDIARGRLQT